MKKHHSKLIYILFILTLLTGGCGKKKDEPTKESSVETPTVAKPEDNTAKSKTEETTPRDADEPPPTAAEMLFMDAARPFIQAVVSKDYVKAYSLLSPHALKKVSVNQFSPADDEKVWDENQKNAKAITQDDFIKLMAKMEERYGYPKQLKDLHVFNTSPEVLSGKGENLDVMFSIGAMPAEIPIEIRKASIRGHILVELTESQWKDVTQSEGISKEELLKNPDFQPYMNFKLVLVEENGELKVGYFEFLPPSMMD